MEMLLTGDPQPASSMYSHGTSSSSHCEDTLLTHFLPGLINVMVPQGKAMEAAMNLAGRVVVNAPLAVRESKRVVSFLVPFVVRA